MVVSRTGSADGEGGGGDVEESVTVVERDEDVMEVLIRASSGDVTVMAGFGMEGGTLVLRDLHIEGPGAGTLSPARLRSFARELGRQEGAEKVIVQGAKRTTGANPGHHPRVIIIEVN